MPNWCECSLKVEGQEPEVSRFVAAARGSGQRYAAGGEPDEPAPVQEFCFHSLHPVPDEVLEQEYGAAGYHWEVANWGTKWGACESRLDERSDGLALYRFDTAWEAPIDFLDEVASDWPGLAFTLEYETEGSCVRGTACWEDGSLESHDEEEIEDEDEDDEDEDDEDDEEEEESLAGTDAG